MPTKNKSGKNFSATVTPLKNFTAGRKPVLFYAPTSKGAGSEPPRAEVKFKVGKGGELLIKIRPGEDWDLLDGFRDSHRDVMEEVLLGLLNSDGVGFDYTPSAAE